MLALTYDRDLPKPRPEIDGHGEIEIACADDPDPRIKPGEYAAACEAVRLNCAFNAKKWEFSFKILDPGEAFGIVLHGYCPFPPKGIKLTPRYKLWRWATFARGNRPTRFDRISPRWFSGKVFKVQVGYTAKKIPHTKKLAPPELQYSEVYEITGVVAGGRP